MVWVQPKYILSKTTNKNTVSLSKVPTTTNVAAQTSKGMNEFTVKNLNDKNNDFPTVCHHHLQSDSVFL